MSTVKQRLENRRDVLVEWCASGIPTGKFAPKSKNDFMSWEDGDLAIQRIGHRNACTTTHPENGPLVADCFRLMQELAKRKPRARQGTEASNKSLRERLRAQDSQIIALASQWTAAKAESDTLRKDLTSLEEKLRDALSELAQYKRDAMKVVAIR